MHVFIVGVKRETSKEKEFGNFQVFDKKDNTYSTFNIQYSNKAFARLFALTQYNMMNNVDVVREAIIDSIKKKKRRTKNASMSWEMNKVLCMAAGNFNRLIQKKDVCTQGVKKMASLFSSEKKITNAIGLLGLSQEDEVDNERKVGHKSDADEMKVPILKVASCEKKDSEDNNASKTDRDNDRATDGDERMKLKQAPSTDFSSCLREADCVLL